MAMLKAKTKLGKVVDDFFLRDQLILILIPFDVIIEVSFICILKHDVVVIFGLENFFDLDDVGMALKFG